MNDKMTKAEKDYKYCIDCWMPKGKEGAKQQDPNCAEFYKESKGWQHQTRCKLCEDAYVQAFKEKYPNTKTKHKYRKLDRTELKAYQKWQRQQTDWSEEWLDDENN